MNKFRLKVHNIEIYNNEMKYSHDIEKSPQPIASTLTSVTRPSSFRYSILTSPDPNYNKEKILHLKSANGVAIIHTQEPYVFKRYSEQDKLNVNQRLKKEKLIILWIRNDYSHIMAKYYEECFLVPREILSIELIREIVYTTNGVRSNKKEMFNTLPSNIKEIISIGKPSYSPGCITPPYVKKRYNIDTIKNANDDNVHLMTVVNIQHLFQCPCCSNFSEYLRNSQDKEDDELECDICCFEPKDEEDQGKLSLSMKNYNLFGAASYHKITQRTIPEIHNLSSTDMYSVHAMICQHLYAVITRFPKPLVDVIVDYVWHVAS